MNIKDKLSPTTAIYLLSCMALMAYIRFSEEILWIVFLIPLVLALIIALSFNKKDLDSDLKTLGIGAGNPFLIISVGFLGAMLSIMSGSVILAAGITTASVLIPNFQNAGSMLTGTIIPASVAVYANAAAQLLIVAPSEESGFRVVVPYIINAFLPTQISGILSALIIIFLSSISWSFMHIPTWISTGTNMDMFYVIIFWGFLYAFLYYITGSVVTPIIAHGMNNVLIILIKSSILTLNEAFILCIVISILSFIAYYTTKDSRRMKKWTSA